MFKNIISNLPFSPSLVGQLSVLSKKIRREESSRKISLVFIIMAIVMQLFIMSSPPESANASDIDHYYNNFVDDSIVVSKTATNVSQGFIEASSSVAQPDDQISYTINLENTSDKLVNTNINENIADILDYSTLIDTGGGLFDERTKTITWSNANLNPNTSQSRTFVIRLLSIIPSTAQGTNNTKSFDCIMSNSLGNLIEIKVACPAIKTVENTIKLLPKNDGLQNILISMIVLVLSLVLYIRVRQLKKEIYIIRKDINNGTI